MLSCYKVGDAYLRGNFMQKNPNLAFSYYNQAYEIAEESGQDEDIKSDIYYRMALCGHRGIGVQQNDLVALKYINDAEFYSYCDRFAHKYRWQSIAKRI